jgi:NADPH:quinone reductase
MKAIYIQQQGPIESLKTTEVARPSIHSDEVLVLIEAAGSNPSDPISARGGFTGSVLPRILGRDFAGRVGQAALFLAKSASHVHLISR